MIVLIRAMGAEGRLKKRRDAARRRGEGAKETAEVEREDEGGRDERGQQNEF